MILYVPYIGNNSLSDFIGKMEHKTNKPAQPAKSFRIRHDPLKQFPT